MKPLGNPTLIVLMEVLVSPASVLVLAGQNQVDRILQALVASVAEA